jgi:hypothetical protein
MTRAVFKATVTLALRSGWVWGVGVVSLLIVWLFGRFGGGVLEMADVAHRPGFTLWAVFFLGQTLAVVAEAHRDWSERTGEAFGALPYRSPALVAAKFAAWYLVWLATATFVYIAEIVLMVLIPRQPLNWFVLWDWFLVVALTLVFTTGVGYVIGARVKRGFAAYLLVMLLFAGGSIFGGQIISSFTFDLFGFGPGTQFDFLLANYFPLTSTHPFPDALPLIFNRIGTVGVGLAAAGSLAWRSARTRRDSAHRPWRITTRLLSITVILAAVLTGLYWQPITWQAMAEARAAQWVPGAETTAGQTPVVGGYTIDAKLHDGALEAQAAIDLQSAADPALFTLNQGLKVSRVTGPDGAPIPFSRSGDMLLVATGGKTGSYTVTYAGAVWQWRKDGWKGLRLEAHIHERSVMIPAAFGWYPLPGRQALIAREDLGWGPVKSGVIHSPVPFRLTAAVPEGLTLVSNAAGGDPVRGAWLMATPYEAAGAEGFRLYLSRENQQQGQQIQERYSGQIAFYQQLVPLNGPITLVEVSDALSAAFDGGAITQYPGAVVMTAMQVGRLDNMIATNRLIRLWWGDGPTDEDMQVRDVAAAFTIDLYRTTHRDPWVPKMVKTFRRAFGPDTEPGRAAMAQLNQLYADRGLEAVSRVLRDLHSQTEPLTWKLLQASLAKEGM